MPKKVPSPLLKMGAKLEGEIFIGLTSEEAVQQMVDETKVAEIISSQVIVFPNDANHVGNMFGGRIMEIMDSCAGIAADRFASDAHHCVTASVETVQFRLPVHVGDILKFDSQVVYAGRTSMVIRVDAYRYARGRQEEDLCTSAHFIFVAMDAEGKPVPVPKLVVKSSKAQHAWETGKAVREQSLKIKSRVE